MRNFIFIFLILFPSICHADVRNGLQAWWTFDEGTGTTATDRTSNGIVCTLTNGPTWVNGKLNNAINFDGSNDELTCTNNDAILKENAAMTTAFWMMARSIGQTNGRIYFRQNVAGTGGPQLLMNTNNTLQFQANTNGANSVIRLTSNNSFSFNIWTHVVVTWDGSLTAANVHIYINGTEAGYQTTTDGIGSFVDNSTTVTVIGNNTAVTRTFDGLIDDMRIYNRVITQAEITQLYNQGFYGNKINNATVQNLVFN